MENNPVLIAEQRLLNLIWLDPNLLDSPEYNENVWIHSSCKAIAKSIDNITNSGGSLNALALYQDVAKYDPSVSLDVINNIINLNDKADTYIKDITEYLKTFKRTLDAQENLDNIKKILASTTVLSPLHKDELHKEFDEAEEKIFSADDSVKRIMTLPEWGDKWNDEFLKRRHGKQYFFNEPILDKLVVDGPIEGCGGLICAASGCGKSTYCLKMVNGFINAEIPCMFFSLEMGAISTYDRLISTRLQVPYSEIVNPTDEESFLAIQEKVAEERKNLDNNKLFRFCEDANISLSDIKKQILKFQEQIGQRYCIVVLDLITMIKDFTKITNGSGMAQTIEIAINNMNAMAKELGIHYIGTAQLNRKGEEGSVSDPDDVLRFRPNRTQIKNSGALLERVRWCISLYRKKFYLGQYFGDDQEIMDSEDDKVEIQVLKQNNGGTEKRYYENFYPECFTMIPVINESSDDDSTATEEVPESEASY